MAPTSGNNSSVAQVDWSRVNLHQKGPSKFVKSQELRIAQIRAQELASDPLHSAKEKKPDVYPTVSSMTLPDKPDPEQIPSKISHIINGGVDKTAHNLVSGAMLHGYQRENWLLVSERYNPAKILEGFQDNRVTKIVGIQNYLHAQPRIDNRAHDDLYNNLFYLDQDNNILYVRYTGMGGQNDVGSTKTIGFYESILKLLKYIESSNYILITDVWPLPAPRHLHDGDHVNMNQLIRNAVKIVANTNKAGSKKFKTSTDSNDWDNFANMTKSLGFDQTTIKRRSVMSVYQHNIINALVSMSQASDFKNCFTADQIHYFLCNNISPPLGISIDDGKVTRKHITRLHDKGYITRFDKKQNGVYVYNILPKNTQLYETNYPDMAAQLCNA